MGMDDQVKFLPKKKPNFGTMFAFTFTDGTELP
jgi:hypothetical protein